MIKEEQPKVENPSIWVKAIHINGKQFRTCANNVGKTIMEENLVFLPRVPSFCQHARGRGCKQHFLITHITRNIIILLTICLDHFPYLGFMIEAKTKGQ